MSTTSSTYLINGKLPVISVFSGAGGLDLGLEATGIFETRCCLEVDSHSCISLRHNRREGRRSGTHGFLNNAVVLQKDAWQVEGETLLRAARLSKGQVALLVGGPPCQSFSVFGRRRGMDDPRGNLMWRFVSYVKSLEPECFWLENVPGLLTVEAGETFKQVLQALESIQPYKVNYYVVEAADYGVPQYRKRIFIFGSRSGIELPQNLPELLATHGGAERPNEDTFQMELNRLPRVCVKHALASLPEELGSIHNHIGRKHSEEIKNRYRNLRFGERDSATRINKLHPDRPSYTIIVGSDKGGGKGHIHPFQPREVTPRESARIQTFPDFWYFSGTSRHPIRQVGNAVPPVLAAVWAKYVALKLFDIPSGIVRTTNEMLVSLGQAHLLPLFNQQTIDAHRETSLDVPSKPELRAFLVLV
ncbi:DNA cytosine methyltransferase [Nostoc sp.]|uniref:DNA cytosine methyltransferase n=1 Tax=Nostoc sp. TaxID=1180 RepID=UPI002FF9F8FB